MRDFVKSLENNQFSKEQEAMLLVGKADTLQAGSNGKCENRSSSCDLSILSLSRYSDLGRMTTVRLNSLSLKYMFR